MNIKRVPCAPDATRPDSRTTLLYVHTTERGPQVGPPWTLHDTLRMHNTMVVKGWSVGSLRSESLGGSDAQLSMRT